MAQRKARKMKLRNKKTGEIIELLAKPSFVKRDKGNFLLSEVNCFNSLAELNEEWEDYEEPKGYYYVSSIGLIKYDDTPFCAIHKDRKAIGNYFETKEEVEKAVEKLKAWKRLKDEGFRFCGWANDYKKKMGKILCKCNSRKATFDEAKQFYADLDLLFGGEE